MREEVIYLKWESITCGEGVYTWSRSQSHVGKGYKPVAEANQSHEGRGYLPGVGTDHMRGGGRYLVWEPIT